MVPTFLDWQISLILPRLFQYIFSIFQYVFRVLFNEFNKYNNLFDKAQFK